MTPEDKHIACLRHTWPDKLRACALPLEKTLMLSLDDVELMLQSGTMLPVLAALEGYDFPETGTFLRLGGFSFKDVDAFHVLANGCVRDGADLRFLLSAGIPRRVRWALSIFSEVGIPVPLELLPWVDIRPEVEFRAFVLDRTLYGITQYHLEALVNVPNRQRFENAVMEWVASLLSDLPEFDMTMDFAIFNTGPRLIEINPFTPKTHLGLYTHKSLKSGQTLFRMCSAP